MKALRPVDHLHGHAHGADERRAPHLVVPATQIADHLPGPLPVLTEQEAATRGLLTREQVADLLGLTPGQVLYRIGMGTLAPVAVLQRTSARAYVKSYPWRRHCSRWYILAPAGVVPLEELPEGWGLIEAGPRGLRARRPAANDPDTVPLAARQVAGLMRATQQTALDHARRTLTQ